MVSNITENVNYTIKWGKRGGWGKFLETEKMQTKNTISKKIFLMEEKMFFSFLRAGWLDLRVVGIFFQNNNRHLRKKFIQLKVFF